MAEKRILQATHVRSCTDYRSSDVFSWLIRVNIHVSGYYLVHLLFHSKAGKYSFDFCNDKDHLAIVEVSVSHLASRKI
jgi:hypothetical protein